MADKIARVAFIADVANFVNNTEKAGQATKGFQDKVGAMALPAAAAFAAVTAAAIDFSKAAAEDAQSAAILANALTNTTGATDAQIASVEDWITKTSMATAVADDQLRPALGTLARATGDVTTAQGLLSTALDVAAATGKPVEAVSAALSKAYAGNLGALNRLVPGLIDTTDKSLTFADAMAQLQEKTAGAAETAAANDPYGQLTITIDETKEAIGAGLLPVIQQLVPYLIQGAQWIQENSRVLLIVGGVIASVSGAILALNAGIAAFNTIATVVRGVTAAWTAAQTILNFVLTANPIGIVIVAIAALIAAIVLAYNNVDWFREGVDKALAFVRRVFERVVEYITVDVPAGFQNLVSFVRGFIDTMVDVGRTVFNVLTAPYRLAFNAIAGFWNDTLGNFRFEIPDWIPLVGGRSWSFPRIPQLAEGGIVTGPTLAMIGERGPEAVVPLDRYGGGINITINGALDPVGVAQQIRRILAQQDARLGLA